jgi:ribosome-associated protein
MTRSSIADRSIADQAIADGRSPIQSPITDRRSPMVAIPPGAVTERFVRASGPGGQNVNKVATAVELRFDLAAAALPEEAKARLRRMAGRRLLDGDVLLVEAHEHRTQGRNRAAAYARLEALVRKALVRPTPRRKTRPTAASRDARLEGKARRSAVKRRRSRLARGEE